MATGTPLRRPSQRACLAFSQRAFRDATAKSPRAGRDTISRTRRGVISAVVAFSGRFPSAPFAVARFVFGEAAGLAAGFVARCALFYPLRESDRRAQEIEFLAQTVF